MTDIKDLDTHPINQFLKWFETAEKANLKNPEAMTLATSSRSGVPSARIVLFKGMNEKGLCFFTNYRSRKARELNSNPRAALLFYWPSLDRQVRIEGRIEKLPASESNEYWQSRPRESQLGALASKQSSVIPNRKTLEGSMKLLEKKFENQEVPRPSHWGGYCLVPNRFEFWLAGDYRLHDRFCYTKKRGKWLVSRLAP